MPLAISGVLGLAAVVLVHEVAEVIVILNGLRLLRSLRAVRCPAQDRRPSVSYSASAESPGSGESILASWAMPRLRQTSQSFSLVNCVPRSA